MDIFFSPKTMSEGRAEVVGQEILKNGIEPRIVDSRVVPFIEHRTESVLHMGEARGTSPLVNT